jgi:Ca-activated chloride channel family protein
MDAWARFHFLRPELFWLLVPWAIGALLFSRHLRAPSPWRASIAPHLLALLERGRPRLSRLGPEVLVLALAAWAVVCAAGPSYRPRATSGDPEQSPLLVVFELSHSMAERDVSPSRAERARLELLDLLHARPDSPTALVVVAGTAHVLMPFTNDVSALEPYVNALSPDLMPSDGQDFEAATRIVEKLSRSSPVPPTVLLISDGLPASGAQTLSKLIHDRRLSTVALAVGPNSTEARQLAALADEIVELSYASRDVPRLLSAVAAGRAARAAGRDDRFWQDEGPTWAWLLVVGTALWFRRGFSLPRRHAQAAVTIALAFVLSGCAPWVEGIWLTANQRGRLAFEHGRYLEAAAAFEDPMWKGLSYYAAEKWDLAAAAVVGQEDADSLFLLANAYAEGGKLESARRTYERALQKRPTFRAARQNHDRIVQLLHSLQEDTDQDDLAKIDQGSDDAAAKLDRDAMAPELVPQSGASVQTPESQAGTLEARTWLAHLTTEPTEFLKRKLAVQAARGVDHE